MTTPKIGPVPLDANQRRLVGHGLSVILCAMFAGIALTLSLLGGLEIFPGNIQPVSVGGTPEGWVRMHVGSITNGLLLIAIAFVLPRIGMNACSQRRVAWTFVAVAWANTAFYFFGNLAPNRGITFGGNRFGDATWMGLFAMAPAFLGAVATVIVLVVLIRQTFRD